jgi:TatD DNase family protein
MDFAYTFGDPATLYLNVTNRCTNRCEFCVARFTDSLGTGRLRGGPEPNPEALLEAIEAYGELEDFDEIVWCGFGEPTYRLDLILEASPIFRRAGVRVRLNTNGHACLIQGRDVLPELAEVIDLVSISLNAPRAERYLEICRPWPGAAGIDDPDRMWEAMLDFLTRAPGRFAEVHASVVGHVLTRDEIRACESLAQTLDCDEFRIR